MYTDVYCMPISFTIIVDLPRGGLMCSQDWCAGEAAHLRAFETYLDGEMHSWATDGTRRKTNRFKIDLRIPEDRSIKFDK